MAQGRRLSKKERKELKKKRREEMKEKTQQDREKGERKSRYTKYTAVAALIAIAGFYLLGSGRSASGMPSIAIEPLEYDFGDVSVSGGVVKTVMIVKNQGKGNLVINDMETSCGCTSATVEKGGKEGPAFGMRGHIPTPVGWSETLKPGETARLNIYYDPLVHPELRGSVTRLIAVYSNDPGVSVKEVMIHANQVD